ncbi:MAG TPA: ferrochelatase [Terriglobia bacterium]|nr:ferrochelatase [Terriglobia bacterium]
MPESPALHRGVLLLAHGGPDSLDDIAPFLSNIRGGRPTPPELLHEVRERYRIIGGKSPLLEISRRQAQALERFLNAGGRAYRVYLGMRNWKPFIRETMQEIQRDGIMQLFCFCLAPQNSAKSVGLYLQHVREAERQLGWEIPTACLESWHDEPLLIEAFAERLREALAAFPGAPEDPPAILFTAHSLPERVLAEGDPYDREVRHTAAAVARRCGISEYRFAYQSQGATAETWLGPSVESVLEDLSRAEKRRVLLCPIGFLADHVEILYDIDVAFQRYATERGILLRRTASLNDSPSLIRAMAALVQRHFEAPEAPAGQPKLS